MYASSDDNVGVDEGSNSVTLTNNNIPEHTHARGTMNITGSFTSNRLGIYQDSNYFATGVFENSVFENNTSGNAGAGYDGNRKSLGFSFDASKSWVGETSPVGKANPDAINVKGAVRRVYIYYRQS